MSYKLKKTRTAFDFISRLPIHRNLDESQAVMVILKPIWQSWLKTPECVDKLSSNCIASSFLASYQDGKITINCANAVTASELKHLQHSLLNFINSALPSDSALIKQIDQIAVRIDLLASQSTNAIANNAKIPEPRSPKPVSQTSLNALNICIKGIENEELAESLKSLSRTLKNSSKP